MDKSKVGLSEHEPAPLNSDDQGEEQTTRPQPSHEILKRKDCITDLELDINASVVNFRSSPEYSHYSWLIFPDDKLKTAWDLCIMILVLYTTIIYTYRISFSDSEDETWLICEYIIDFMFFMDSVFTFFTCYFGNSSELVVSHKMIAINYLKLWFWVDVLGFFPFEVFVSSKVGTSVLMDPDDKPVFRLLRILKITRIFKWWNNALKIQELKEFLHGFKIKLTRLKLLCVGFILFCHVMCCFWCMLPRAYHGYDNWERDYKIQDDTNLEKYLAGIYWIITTVFTIGFGDIVPKNNLEISIAICVMSAGVFVYSYTISSITSLIAADNSQNSRIDELTNVLQGIATEFKLSKSFHKRLCDALIYNLREKRADFNTVLNSLPPNVASKLKLAMNQKLLQDNQFFKEKPPHFVQRILEFLMPYKVEADEYIYKDGSPCDELYFVLSGEVVFVYNTNIIYESVTAGGYFGDAELFYTEERETTVKSIKRTKMLTLDRETLLNILKDYEELKVDMIIKSMIKRKQLRKSFSLNGSHDSDPDGHISAQQLTPDNLKSDEDCSADFIKDCSSSLDPQSGWD